MSTINITLETMDDKLAFNLMRIIEATNGVNFTFLGLNCVVRSMRKEMNRGEPMYTLGDRKPFFEGPGGLDLELELLESPEQESKSGLRL